MTNFMVKSGTGSGRICFTNLATSGSGRISQKQIRYSPITYLLTYLRSCCVLWWFSRSRCYSCRRSSRRNLSTTSSLLIYSRHCSTLSRKSTAVDSVVVSLISCQSFTVLQSQSPLLPITSVLMRSAKTPHL